MARRLPPFAPLLAFDAVARHRSFTRAGDELGLTQSAISHQIRRLEEFFGAPLFKRLNPGVELSADGARLRDGLTPLLDGIANLASAPPRGPGRAPLRVGAGSSLAAWWLVRRLRAFRVVHPEIEIDFAPVDADDIGDKSFDVRIAWTTLADSAASPTQAPLFRERVFPVCAPSVLPGGRPLANPAALLDLPLIQKGAAPTGEWSWALWFRELGLKGTPPRGLVLGDMGLCLTAAVEGAGIAIARSLLVADAIADGRLVPALAAPPDMLSTKVHVARWSDRSIGDRHVAVLVDWLAREAAATTRQSESAPV